MTRFIHTVMTVLFITLCTFGSVALASNETEKQRIQNCVDTGLPRIIAGEEIGRYISLSNFSLNAVGRGNWDTLGKVPGAQDELRALILTTIEKKARTEIRKQAAQGIDLTKTKVAVSNVVQKKDRYKAEGVVTSPSGTSYRFESIVTLNGNQCILHSIIVEGIFSIAQDLGNHPDIIAFMKQYKLKR